MPPVETAPAGSGPRSQLETGATKSDQSGGRPLQDSRSTTNFVQIPVLVKDKTAAGRWALAKDFTVLENGKPQKLTYFTSDPFQLSVAIVLDLGMPDIAVQKVNQTYSALAGAFSPYDEFALYTYSSTVSQVSDFTGKPESLRPTEPDETVRGHETGRPC